MFCPACFGARRWPWESNGDVCHGCRRASEISGEASANEVIDRRDRDHKPRPGMIWSDRHSMWVDPDTRSPEEKALHDKIAADVEAEIRRSREQGR